MTRATALAVVLALSGCLGPPPGSPPPGGPGPDPEAGFELVRVATGLSSPIQIVSPHDGTGRLFVVEQGGLVKILAEGRVGARPFLDLRDKVRSGGEQGLLSIAFDPDFARNRRFFASYTDARGDTAIERFLVRADDPDRADAASGRVILSVDQPFANHNGGLVLFGPDGMLYAGLGDGGSGGDPQGHGQNPATLLGSILRLDVSGASYEVPRDNPFVGRSGFAGEVWALGLRNPWRFSFDRQTGDAWIADVGQDRTEEVNHVPAASAAGRNYGWNVWEGTTRHRSGETATEATFPVFTYPLRQAGTCAVTGGYVYRGAQVPALRGVYLFADYCTGTVWGLRGVGGEWRGEPILRTQLRITSFGEDEAGELYVVDHGGSLHRFEAGSTKLPSALLR
ncbi:MAG TPA: PQQ-dependent sugar dehydrogenase [Candidatus Thermoplasmatota archaeon]|nr:PQQ-dependent sugar dehydrogenase [Candidatus Thermoplasmatota archaeon]